MQRGTTIASAVAAMAVAAAGWLYVENRDLEAKLAKMSRADGVSAAVAAADDARGAAARDDAEAPRRKGGLGSLLRMGRDRGAPPMLEPEKKETRAERRMRRQKEIAAFLGRHNGETEAEYRARLLPLIETGLSRPRATVDESRREAEEAAGVTPEQSAQMDAIFDDVYAEAMDLTNAAIQAGDLTPYERNVTGILNVAGGLGAVLGSAESRVGEVISPDQYDRMKGAGFDLGEYLGVSAPWENLTPPPPPPDG